MLHFLCHEEVTLSSCKIGIHNGQVIAPWWSRDDTSRSIHSFCCRLRSWVKEVNLDMLPLNILPPRTEKIWPKLFGSSIGLGKNCFHHGSQNSFTIHFNEIGWSVHNLRECIDDLGTVTACSLVCPKYP